jgi:Protein of unknown function (DUF992)
LTFVFAEIGLMRLSTIIIAAAALAGSFATANAVPAVQAGLLECRGGQNVGFVVGSVANLECVFQSPGRRPEAYVATVRRLGVDLGVTAQTQFKWSVNAPTTRLGRGELAGNYGGVGANASIGVGGGGNFLVGGPGNAYALQPISVQGQTGLNVAAGIAGLELEPVGFGHRGHGHRHRHHG